MGQTLMERLENLIILAKWVYRVMQAAGDILSQVIREAYGQSLDWDSWATPNRGDSPFIAGLRDIFPQLQRHFRPQVGDEMRYRFWQDNWSGVGRLCDIFPRVYALGPDPGTIVRAQWSDAWTPALLQALSDQRLADLLSLQSRMAEFRPSDGIRDRWVWCSSSFSSRAVYRFLRGQEAPEDPQLVRRSRLVWKQWLPLKIGLFGWLLLRRHIMTRTLRCQFDPEASAVCPLCNEVEEDCSHLFFKCPLAQAAWRAAGVGHLDTSSDEEFWRSISGGVFCREADWRRIFAT